MPVRLRSLPVRDTSASASARLLASVLAARFYGLRTNLGAVLDANLSREMLAGERGAGGDKVRGRAIAALISPAAPGGPHWAKWHKSHSCPAICIDRRAFPLIRVGSPAASWRTHVAHAGWKLVVAWVAVRGERGAGGQP